MRKYGPVGIFLTAVLLLSACGTSQGTQTGSLQSGSVTAVTSDTVSEPENEKETSAVESNTAYDIDEINIENGSGGIYGRLYRPAETASDSIVILSHGFGGSYMDLEDYAEEFAENGITAFAFDFTGGGSRSRSGGSTTDMSVLTEASDLNTVIDYFQSDSGQSYGDLFLLGASQGGFVSTYVAGTRPDDIAGLIALYPAYVLQDDSRERNPDPENGPDTSSLMGINIGRIYDVDAQSFDIFDIMAGYPGKVLIIHGTSDSIAPISYSERAAETFPDAKLVKLDGAGHGFYGDDEEQAANLSVQFVKENEEQRQTDASGAGASGASSDTEETFMTMTIGDTPVQVDWEDNDTVTALKEMVKGHPLSIQMSMYGGFEQVGPIGSSLPRDDSQTTTSAGDIVLYSGDQIVVFYGSNSWSYTRLGKITDKTDEELAELLSNGDVTITIEG